MKIDKKLIKELTDCLIEFNLSELEYGDKDLKIKVSKKLKNFETQVVKTENSKKKEVFEEGFKVTSPIVGTAYLAPEPGGKKFIEVGQKVQKGQTILIVEAMKTMNHVPSSKDGIVKKILVEDGQPVEFGQALVLLN
tara:strand:+ start:741 stop:1151 length:411 start_codon:yes stop_codon:yes gene_type:complete